MKTVDLIILLLCIARSVVSQQSPCPEIFQFQTDGRQIWGLLRIENVDYASDFLLEVKFTAHVLSIPVFCGNITYDADEQEAYDDITNKKMLRYKILFHPEDNQPILTEIKLNNRIICVGDDHGITNVTRFRIRSNLTPTLNGQRVSPITIKAPFIQDQFPLYNQYPSIPRRSGISHPVKPVTISPITDVPYIKTTTTTRAPISTSTSVSGLDKEEDPTMKELNEICGKAGPIAGPRIINGDSVNKGDWPWIAAIFLDEENGRKFTCGGTLITARTVLTAAHCILRRDGKEFGSKDIFVLAGIYNINEPEEGVSEAIRVSEVHVHSDFDSQLRNYDADIAILIVKDNFKFSMNIKPICLWTGENELSQIVDFSGTVVGWGKDETGKPFTEFPKKLSERIISLETCRAFDDVYKRVTSERTICAGSRSENRGPCTGDSGSGFVLKMGDRWMIRGIVSAGFDDYSTDSCDLTQYSIYTDVAKFLVWIRRVMKV